MRHTFLVLLLITLTMTGCGSGGSGTTTTGGGVAAGPTPTPGAPLASPTPTTPTPTPTPTGSPTPATSPSPTASVGPSPAPQAEFWVPYLTLAQNQGVTWDVDGGIRATNGTAAPTVVVLPDGRLRLFYPRAQGGGLGSSVSSDGLNFTEEPGARLQVIGDIAVIYLTGGGYRIIFPDGALGSQTFKSATSTDGFNFTLEAGSRFTPPATDAGICQVPQAIKLADGRWRLYYIGDFQGTASQNRNSIRTALSGDEGVTWTPETTGDTFSSDWVDPNVLYLTSGGFRLYTKTSTPGVPGAGNSLLSHTDATDGLHFPALTTDLDGTNRLDPFVIHLPDGTIRMFFATPSGIASATAR